MPAALVFFKMLLIVKPGAAGGGRLVYSCRVAGNVVAGSVGIPAGVYHIGIVFHIVVAHIIVAARSRQQQQSRCTGGSGKLIQFHS